MAIESDDLSLIGIAAVVTLCVLTGLLIMLSPPASTIQDAYTAVYMNTTGLDRNITAESHTLDFPFYIENHEGADTTFTYKVDIHFKDSILRKDFDTWTEDLNVDDQFGVVSGKLLVPRDSTGIVELSVPVNSTQKWKNANVTVWIFKEGSPDVYRSLRIWAIKRD